MKRTISIIMVIFALLSVSGTCTPTYVSVNSNQHRVTMCSRCSYYATHLEYHTLAYSASTNNYHCTECGYVTTNPGGVS